MASVTEKLSSNVVAITIAIVVIALVFLPIVSTAVNMTVDGDETSITNASSPTAKYSLADVQNIATITITATSGGITVDPATATSIISSSFKIDVTASTLTVQVASGAPVVYDTSDSTLDANLVLDIGNGTANFTGTAATTLVTIPSFSKLYIVDASGDYGLFTPTDVNTVYVNSTKSIIAITGTAIVTEKSTASSPIAITSTASEDMKNVYIVTDAGTGGAILTLIDCPYYEQVPAFDDNLKTIFEILPILVAVGVLVGCVYLFMGKSAVGN